MDRGEWDLRKPHGRRTKQFLTMEPKILSKDIIKVKEIRIVSKEDRSTSNTKQQESDQEYWTGSSQRHVRPPPPGWASASEEDSQSSSSESSVKGEKTDTLCCGCQERSVLKVSIGIFAVFNLAVIAVGGVGFTLGLVDYWENQDIFTYIMVGSSCLVCWGTLGTTMDMLALLGVCKGKRDLLTPWLAWYILEVICCICILIVSVVYTETFYLLPILLKTFLTLALWFRMRLAYSSSFGSFNTSESQDMFY